MRASKGSSAALEMPLRLRINAVSPPWVSETLLKLGETCSPTSAGDAPSTRGALLACSLRCRFDRVRRQLVKGLDDQRRQPERVWLRWVLAVSAGKRTS